MIAYTFFMVSRSTLSFRNAKIIVTHISLFHTEINSSLNVTNSSQTEQMEKLTEAVKNVESETTCHIIGRITILIFLGQNASNFFTFINQI